MCTYVIVEASYITLHNIGLPADYPLYKYHLESLKSIYSRLYTLLESFIASYDIFILISDFRLLEASKRV